jgi:hypothetical protein
VSNTLLQDGSFYQDCYIPDYLLKPDCELIDHAPRCPVVVFINPRSGHQLGSILIKTYRVLLNEAQVPSTAAWKSCNTETLLSLDP